MQRLGQRYELVLVDDGSQDASLAVMHQLAGENPAVRVVALSRNFGKEIALTAGLDHAHGQAVVVIDTDLQDPPELIEDLLAGWQQGYDMVYAQRLSRAGESWLKKATARSFYRLMQRVGGPVRIPPDVGDFRLMSREAVEALSLLRERHRFMKGLFAWVGYRQMAVPYARDARFRGQSKWNYWRLWNFSLEGITSFTTAPLKMTTYVGLAVALSAFLFGVWIVLKTLLFGEPVQGFPTIMVTILFLGGLQLVALGLIGEYLGRIFNETKNRPLYLVRREQTTAAPALGPFASAAPARTDRLEAGTDETRSS